MKSLPDLKVFSHSLNMKTFVQICEKWQRLQYKTQSWVFPSFQNFWFSRPWIIIGITKLIILEGKEKDFRKLLCKCFDALKWVTNNTNQIKKQPVEICYKKDILKKFAKFTRKQLCRSLIFNKAECLKPATLLKMRLRYRCFPVKSVKFLRAFFYRTHPGDCSTASPNTPPNSTQN